MKAHSLLTLCALAMLAVGCTTKQSYIQEDNPLGYSRQDIIEYLEDYQQRLNSDSIAQAIVVKQQYINDIQGWIAAEERVDSTFESEEKSTDSIDLLAQIPLLDGVLSKAVKLLRQENDKDYLQLMDDNWNDFFSGPMATTMENFKLLSCAYAPLYWGLYACIQHDTTLFYKQVLDKLDLIHFTARSVSMMHEPPMPFYSYFVTTRVGIIFNLSINQYEEAINYGKQYIEDIIETGFFDNLSEYSPDVISMHNEIINLFEFCCYQIDVSGEELTMLINSLRIPEN